MEYQSISKELTGWSLRRMDTLEQRHHFVRLLRSLTTAIANSAGSVEFHGVYCALIIAADENTLKIIDKYEDTKHTTLKGTGIQRLLHDTRSLNLSVIDTLEELESALLLLDLPHEEVYSWIDTQLGVLRQWEPITSLAKLKALVAFINERALIFAHIPLATIHTMVCLSRCLEQLTGFDEFTLGFGVGEELSTWLSKLTMLCNAQPKQFFATREAPTDTEEEEVLPLDQIMTPWEDVVAKDSGDESDNLDMNSISADEMLSYSSTSTTSSSIVPTDEKIEVGNLVYVNSTFILCSSSALDAIIDPKSKKLTQSFVGPYKVAEVITEEDQYLLDIPEEVVQDPVFPRKSLKLANKPPSYVVTLPYSKSR